MTEQVTLLTDELAALLSAQTVDRAEPRPIAEVVKRLTDKKVLATASEADGAVMPTVQFEDLVRVLQEPHVVLHVTKLSSDGVAEAMFLLDPISGVELRMSSAESVAASSFPASDLMGRLRPLIVLPSADDVPSGANGTVAEILNKLLEGAGEGAGVVSLEITSSDGGLTLVQQDVWLFDGAGHCWTMERSENGVPEFLAQPTARRAMLDRILDALPA